MSENSINPICVTSNSSILFLKKGDYVFVMRPNDEFDTHLYLILDVMPTLDLSKIKSSPETYIYDLSDGFLILKKVK